MSERLAPEDSHVSVVAFVVLKGFLRQYFCVLFFVQKMIVEGALEVKGGFRGGRAKVLVCRDSGLGGRAHAVCRACTAPSIPAVATVAAVVVEPVCAVRDNFSAAVDDGLVVIRCCWH
jgi:hypothetical protein